MDEQTALEAQRRRTNSDGGYTHTCTLTHSHMLDPDVNNRVRGFTLTHTEENRNRLEYF